MDNVLAMLMARKGGGGSGGGADWNASEGEDGYVKNRTHYSETAEVVLFDGTVQYDNSYGVQFGDKTAKIKPEQEYTVIFDGVVYKCIAVGASIGAKMDFSLNTTPPFDFSVYPFAIMSDSGLTGIFPDTNEHSIKITTIDESVHKIDKKFLPFGECKFLEMNGTNYGEDIETCSLSFDEAFSWFDEHWAILGVYRDYQSFEWFFLTNAWARLNSDGTRYIRFIFTRLSDAKSFTVFYLEDGTFTTTEQEDN